MSAQDAPFAVLLPAAGRSLRYAGGSKLAERLGGRSVLAHAAAAFLCRSDVAQLIIATGDAAGAAALLGQGADPRVVFAAGGASRAESVRAALSHVAPGIPFVAIHDAARPLVSQALITAVFVAARAGHAVAPATPVAQTIKQAGGPLPARVERTLARHTLWALQTPQAMRADTLRSGFASCPLPLGEITDDLQLLELSGHEATLIPGEELNLKITFASDLRLAEWHLAERHRAERDRAERHLNEQSSNFEESGLTAAPRDNPPHSKHS